MQEERDHAYEMYHDLSRHNEERYDRIAAKQEEILSSRLGLVPPVQRETSKDAPQPIRRRAGAAFAQIKANFEAKQKEAYWRARTEELEKEVLNDKTTPAPPQTIEVSDDRSME